eukprot:TRINITY_DN15506_c0_g1_i1.p2 TRINITY_DN15506_c0_g1~~TRINITY_DN15506_c0_g1_i1.p2  ORF type:complete len:118 (-),score=35.19 TRINITY_DN15506_c0_g1_i1:80-433(-)
MATALVFTASKTLAEATSRGTVLHREMLRYAPTLVMQYSIDLPVPEVRRAITKEFQKHKGAESKEVIDMLVWKGQQDMEETRLLFKQKGHIMQYFFARDNTREYSDFSKAFFAGQEV